MKTFCLVLISSFVGLIAVQAQIPRTVSYQGVLTENGSPLPNGNRQITLRIYENQVGGAPLHEELKMIMVEGGLFSTEIGPIPESLPFDKPYWLAVMIDGTNELSPRTPFTAVPYALHASIADALAPTVKEQFWNVGGNSNLSSDKAILGIEDAIPLELQVDNVRAVRYEPGNIILAGHQLNTITPEATGSAILSGGDNTDPHTISGTSECSTIAGGEEHTIDSSAKAVISGGARNTISGNSSYSGISSGQGNKIDLRSQRSMIGGGSGNEISGSTWSMIGGGQNNRVNDESSSAVVAGGFENEIKSSLRSAIVGGWENRIVRHAQYSAIGGGAGNTIDSSLYSVIPGGKGMTLRGRGSFGFLTNNTSGFGAGTRPMTITDEYVAVFGNADLWLANNDGSASQLRLYEAERDTGVFPSTTHFSSFTATDQDADIQYVLPASSGTTGQVLSIASINGTTVWLEWSDSENSSTSDTPSQNELYMRMGKDDPTISASVAKTFTKTIEHQAKTIADQRTIIEEMKKTQQLMLLRLELLEQKTQ